MSEKITNTIQDLITGIRGSYLKMVLEIVRFLAKSDFENLLIFIFKNKL